MRKLLTLLLLIVFIPSFGQLSIDEQVKNGLLELKYKDPDLGVTPLHIPFENGNISFSLTVKNEGFTAQQLYDKAKIAMTEFWRSAKDVTQLDDPNNKIVIVKGVSDWLLDGEAMFTQGFKVRHTMKIECRDDRYRISMYGFTSYNIARTSWTSFEVTATQNECLEQGLKSDGTIRRNMYGLSFLAWFQVSKSCSQRIQQLITNADANTSEDW